MDRWPKVVQNALRLLQRLTQRSLDNTFINIASANSLIRDTDFGFEISSLRRSQFLYQASLSVLGQALQQPQGVLNLIV